MYYGNQFISKPCILIGNSFAQVAWVVRDIQQAEKFFVESIGIPRFMKMENLRAQNIEGTYQGAPGDTNFISTWPTPVRPCWS